MKKGIPKFHKEIEEFIEEYNPYINYVCEKREFLREHWDDMKQYIVMQLIKLYCKKYKYDDFDWVVRSAIRRKAIDFVSKHIRNNRNMVYNEDLGNETYGEALDFISHKPMELFKDLKRNENIINMIDEINFKITGPFKQFFNDWDRDFMDSILFLFNENEEITKKDIAECMGLEEKDFPKFNNKLLSFRGRLKKVFGN